jgi:hypothetical protein
MDVNDGVISGQRGGAKSGQLRGWRFEAKSPLRAKGAFCFKAPASQLAGFCSAALAGNYSVVDIHPFLAAAMTLSPPEYAVVSLPQKCAEKLPDAARSDHGRYFTYVHGAQNGKPPGDIVTWHLWVS